MQHARQHAETRTHERRRRLAHEAARLMAEGGIRDYQQAKRKAARRLGIHDDAALPRNSEIDQALRDYQRLFQSPAPEHTLRARREATLQALEFFEPFRPRTLAQVVDDADPQTVIVLHLHADDPHEVALFVQEHGIPAQSRLRRVRLDRQRTLDADSWSFLADGRAFELLVLPANALRQAPLSAVDERPLARLSAAQLRLLLSSQA